MNTFELKIIDSDGTSSEPSRMVAQEIWIDGIHLDEPHVVDVCELVRSIFRPDEFFFFTCTCGEPGCAGIWEGFNVRHVPGKILWRFRRPVKEPHSDQTEEELGQQTSCTNAVEYEFDREQFVSALDQGLRELRAKPSNSEYCPYGFDREKLDRLDVRHRPLDWQENPVHRRLYILADETYPLFLDGQFVSLEDLGLSNEFLVGFIAWKDKATQLIPWRPDQRLEWLEDARSLALFAYLEGLPADIDIRLIAYQWTADDQLDRWAPESRLVSRLLLDRQSKFEDPYICLSAKKGRFELWFDMTPEAKNQRYRFIGYGSRVTEDCPFLIPFALEKSLSEWASQMPSYEKPASWERWLLGKPNPQEPLSKFDWPTFHAAGVRLAAEVKALVGHRAIVFYELPWEAPPYGDSRRLEIAGE